jgi:hypothetical protein
MYAPLDGLSSRPYMRIGVTELVRPRADAARRAGPTRRPSETALPDFDREAPAGLSADGLDALSRRNREYYENPLAHYH